MTKKSMDTFVQKLENCLSERFNTVKTLKADQDILVQQIQLIKRQFDIDDGDEKLKKFKATKFNDFEHKPSLMGATVIETVYYWLVVRKARPPDFGNFEFSQVAVTPENNNKTTYGERISG